MKHSLPIIGKVSVSSEKRFQQAVEIDDDWAEFSDLYTDSVVIKVEKYANVIVDIKSPKVLGKKEANSVFSLNDLYQRTYGLPHNSLMVLVTFENDRYRLYGSEIVTLLDYIQDEQSLEFTSIRRNGFEDKNNVTQIGGRIIEYCQIASLFSDGGALVIQYHERNIIIGVNTPIYLNTSFGRYNIANVITFHLDSANAQTYIGLVIGERLS